MIGFLRGTIEGYDNAHLYLDVNGVGYEVNITEGIASELPPIGDELKVYTHLVFKEDDIRLFGFLRKDDLSIFKQLIQVSGIGPKGAQAILSVLSPDELRFAILAGDAKAIAKAPGVGAKTAQRVIIDLKDKISLEDTFEHAFNAGGKVEPPAPETSGAREEAIEALTALGYSSSDAYKAVRAADDGTITDSNLLLKAALKYI
ncbi:MAG: Holliday junction branch migration protein RuvA [Lachnospiraceae bacterium]|nr:Holliday junction branch migration protein RuvA [Lachnospiraceae bacterium]